MTVRQDNPSRELFPERVAYANGMLLDDADFRAEQAYHRGRLARLARYLHGDGTVAGLDVTAGTGPDARVTVSPGLAVDRIGRLCEAPQALCLTLSRWFEDRQAEHAEELERGGPGTQTRLMRAFRTGAGDTPDHVLADVFLGFRDCETALRPAFATGNFDALDAVSPLRLREVAVATMVLRAETDPPLPRAAHGPALEGDFAARLTALGERKRQTGWIEDALWNGDDGTVEPDIEHPADVNPADVFLARLMLPATAGTPPARNTAIDPTADNAARHHAYSTAELLALIATGD
ncbi:hypothetical protein [Mangrovicoccus sp. HB161399]|uniref:hypothetical protein n=1 Tax=Mangrovicoccus sp. HB161399 TaxID=2720392 RepID=UPI001557C32A|nr:hypothetical protein [Mangrovicoccus sp. HB161399]